MTILKTLFISIIFKILALKKQIDSIISIDFNSKNFIIKCEYINAGRELIILSKLMSELEGNDFQVHVIHSDYVGSVYSGTSAYFFNKELTMFCFIMKDLYYFTLVCHSALDNVKVLRYALNKESIFGICISADNSIVVGSYNYGFKMWVLSDKNIEGIILKLPINVVNVPTRNQASNLMEFSINCAFLIVAVKNLLVIYNIKSKSNAISPLVAIPAHNGRIINLQCIFDGKNEKAITSSIDKSVKVWNLKNALSNKLQFIDKMERPIEGISVLLNYSKGYPFILANTRSSASLWNIEKGNIQESFSTIPNSFIVNCHLISSNKFTIVICESKLLVIYNYEDKLEKTDEKECWDGFEFYRSFYVESKNILLILSYKYSESKIICNVYNLEKKMFLESLFEYYLTSALIHLYPVLSKNERYLYFCESKSFEKSKFLIQFSVDNFTAKKIKLKKYFNKEIEVGKYEIICLESKSENLVALRNSISDKGYLFDFKRSKYMKKIHQWSGQATLLENLNTNKNSVIGLFSPDRGGLQIFNINTNQIIHSLIQRSFEGLCQSFSLISESKKYIIYYRANKSNFKVFRLSDGKFLTEINLPSEIKCIVSKHSTSFYKLINSSSRAKGLCNEIIFVGCSDGALITFGLFDYIEENRNS